MKERKIINLLKLGALFFGMSLLLWNCENESELIPEKLIETVSLNEALTFFNSNQKKLNKSSNSDYVTPFLNSISQQEITNSSELMTVIGATTIYEEHYSRILFLKINNEIKSVVFSMYENESSITEHFSGEIVMTELDGTFVNGYRLENGIAISQFLKKNQNKNNSKNSSSDVCRDHGNCFKNPSCNLCTQSVSEVNITATASSSGSFSIWTILFDQNDNLGNSTYEWSFEKGGAEGDSDPYGSCTGGKVKSVMGACYCPEGFEEDRDGNCVKKPCVGNPVENPEIAPQLGPSGMDGGLHNTCTRTGRGCAGNSSRKTHDGVDIKNPYGAPIFAMYDGTARLATQYKPGTTIITAAGYHVSIISTINGETVRNVYFHMQEKGRAFGVIKAGDIIGYQGVSGNLGSAIKQESTTSHVHIKTRVNGVKADPLDYLATTIDPSTGQVTNPCR